MAAQQIGIVTVVIGHVVAVNADGEERVLAVGDAVYADEIIRTSDAGAVTIQFNDGGWFDLGRNAQAVLDADVYSPDGPEGEATGAVASVEDIQAAILAGADPTELLPPTAAGPAAGGASSEGGHSFVVLNHEFVAVNPEAGIPTSAEPLLFENSIDIILPTEEPEPSIAVSVDVDVEIGGGEPGEDGVVLIPGGTPISGGVAGASVIEGSNGSSHAVAFLITLSEVSSDPVTVTYTIVPGTASHPDDYFDGAQTGTVTIPPGYIGFTVTQNIVADILVEGDETFQIVLSNPIGATLTNDRATVTIIDDDQAPQANDDTNWVQEDQFTDEGEGGGAVVATGNVLQSIAHPGDPSEALEFADAADVDDNDLTLTWGAETAVYGTIVRNADGSYVYQLNNDDPAIQGLSDGETLTETFTYTITDGVNTPDTGTLTITIFGANDVPTLVTDSGNPEGAHDVVYEAGLTNGSGVGPTTVTVTGTFTVSDPDGLDDIQSVTIKGTTIAIGSLVGSEIAGTHGTLKVTGYDAATGVATYSYTLTSPTTDGAGTETDSFTLTTSDGTASSAPASIVIDIVDDEPVARDDADSVTEDGPLTADGNVLTGSGGGDDNTTDGVADTAGADGVGSVVWTDVSGNTVAGSYGTLTVGADGSYSYALNNALPAVQALDAGQVLTESFTYTLSDGDGDSAPATLTITIFGANDGASVVTAAASGPDATVYESGLNPDGSNAAADTETTTGSFTVSATDGIATVVIGGTVFTLAQVQAFGTTNGVVNTGQGELKLTGYTGTATGGTISYSYTLSATIDNDSVTPTSPDAVTAAHFDDSVALTVNGVGGTTASDDLVIRIVDDVPSVTLAAEPEAAITLDESLGTDGSVQNEGGATNDDEAASTDPDDIGYAKVAAADLFTNTTVFGADGPAAANPTVYTLSVGPAASGLTDTLSGQTVVLSNNAGVIEGRTQSGSDLVFTVSVDAATGEVTVHQYRAVVHDNVGAPNDPNDHDESTEPASLASNALLLEATVTDGDGDSASSNALDLGALIHFEDDGPAIGTVDEATLDNAAAQSFTGTYDVDPGTDGLGSASLVGNTAPAGLTAGGQAVQYFVDPANPNVLIAYTGADASEAANQVFKLTLQPGSDQYTFELFQPLDGPITELDITGDTAVGAGPEEARILSGDGTPPLAVLSGWTAGTGFDQTDWEDGSPAADLTLDEVNGSESGWGVGNNNFNTGDFMRFDFGDADDFDGAGVYVPPAGFSGPAVTFANFEFTSVNQPTTIAYVVRYVDGSTSSGSISLDSEGSATIPSAGNTQFIDYIELYGQDVESGGVKVDLVSLGTVTAGAPDPLVFNTTVTDGDGDTASKPITVTLEDVNDAPTVVDAQATVSEEGLDGGIADTAGTPTDVTDATVFSGHMALGDPDGDTLTVTLGEPSDPLSSGGVELTWTGAGTQTLTGTANGETVVTVTIQDNGDYTVTLAKPLDHPDSNVEDVLSFSVPVTVSDGDASTDGAIQVSVEDDMPKANPVVNTGQGAAGQDTNLLLILDVSGSMDDPSGVQGMTRLELLKTAMLEMLEQYDALGEAKVRIVTFSTTAQAQGSEWMTVDQARAVILGLTADGATNYDDALLDAMTAFDSTGKLDGAANVAYFVSDGRPTTSNSNPDQGGSVTNPELGDGIGDEDIDPGDDEISYQEWEAFLNDNGIKSYALGMGIESGAQQADLDPIAYDGIAGTDMDASIVDGPDVIPTLVATVPAPATIGGNLVAGALSGFGADGGHVKSIVVEEITYTYDPAGDGSITPSAAGSAWSFDAATNILTVTLTGGSRVTVDMDDGAYTFTAPAGQAATAVVGFTLVDGDGDTASSTLTVSVDQSGTPLIVRDDIVITNQPAADISIPHWALLANDTNARGASALAVIAAAALSSGDTATLGSEAIQFTDVNPQDGAFTYTASNGSAADTANATVDRTTSNTLNGGFLGEILVDNGTGNHTLNGNAGDDVLIGNGGNDTLNGGEGNDILAGGAGDDAFNGGAGNDTAAYMDAAGPITASLISNTADGEGNDTFNGIENLIGSASGDSLTGNDNANTLMGGAGDDILVGNDGDDLLIGGPGDDTMTGGAGADTFQWGAGDLAGSTMGDVINDFTPGAGGDKLDVADLLTGYVAGVSDPEDFVQLEASGSGTVVKVDVDGGGDNFVTLATLNGVTGQTVDSLIGSGNLVVTHDP